MSTRYTKMPLMPPQSEVCYLGRNGAENMAICPYMQKIFISIINKNMGR